MRWRKLSEVENERNSHNFSLFAISLPEIIKIGENLTNFWQKKFAQFFETRCACSFLWLLFRFLCSNAHVVWFGLNRVFAPVKWRVGRIVPKMTHNVSRSTLNLTIPYYMQFARITNHSIKVVLVTFTSVLVVSAALCHDSWHPPKQEPEY